MEIEFRSFFVKDLKGKDSIILRRLKSLIEKIETLNSLEDIPNIKRLKEAEGFYRIRVGDYRVGLKFEHKKLIFIRFLHRREIYRYFP